MPNPPSTPPRDPYDGMPKEQQQNLLSHLGVRSEDLSSATQGREMSQNIRDIRDDLKRVIQLLEAMVSDGGTL